MLMTQQIEGVALQTILNILRFNPHMLASAIQKAYEAPPRESNQYFLAVADLYVHGEVPLLLPVAFLLAITKITNADAAVRALAVKMLDFVCTKHFSRVYAVPPRITAFDASLAAQVDITHQVAAAHSDHALAMVEEACERFRMVDIGGKERILRFIEPWLPHVDLSYGRCDLVHAAGILEVRAPHLRESLARAGLVTN